MNLDLTARTVSVRQQHVEPDTGELVAGPPKSRAGVRTVAIPAAGILALRDHLDQFTAPEPDSLLFTGSRGGTLRRSNFRRAAKWDENTRKIGFHDLRHTGNTIAASSGASLKDLMQRMGHDSVRAALIYQHSTAEADRKIVDAMNSKIAQDIAMGLRVDSPTPANGTVMNDGMHDVTMNAPRSSTDVVESGWRNVRADGRVRPELLDEAYAEPRLRQLFPWTGMGELHFSRCTSPRWTWDIPYIAPTAGDGYMVLGPRRGDTVGAAATPAQAVAMVVERLPSDCGPAFVGTPDELAAHERSTADS